MSENLGIDYDFSLDNDFNTFEYNSIGVSYDNDKLLTKINFIEKMAQSNANSLERNRIYI